MQRIDNYLNNVLTPQLQDFGVPDDSCIKVTANIKHQMLSLLQLWQDKKLRNTVLLLGLEEGMFYEPKAKTETKCFVVVTIRNSMFETLSSVAYKELNAKREITDEEVKLVMQRAVAYFAEIDFDKLAGSLEYGNINNIYLQLRDEYKLVWTALEQIANNRKLVVRFEKTPAKPDEELIKMFETADMAMEDIQKTVNLSGYEEKMDPQLVLALKQIYTFDELDFAPVCFKMATRNVRKLFRIINFVLGCNRAFVTSNYYITNGYAETRKNIIRAAHLKRGIKENILNTNGMSPKHLKSFKKMNQFFLKN